MVSQQAKHQKGAIQLLLLFSAIAVIAFLGLSSLAPLQDKLLSTLNRKSDSFASEASNTSHTAKVLVLKYYPLDSSGQNLDPAIAGTGQSLSAIRTHVNTVTDLGISRMTNGSKFHGYKDETAQPAVTYQVFDTKEYLEALPVSTIKPSFSSPAFRPDYRQILTRENICNYVDNQGVSQVWVWGYHHGNIEPAESDMSMGYRSQQFWNHSSYGDVSNSEQSDNLPICNNTYVLYNYNYTRGLGELLEDHGHQIEALYRFIDNNLWTDYQKPNGETDPNIVNHCGWTHSPPNSGDWTGPRGQYQWNDKTLVKSNCEDWQPGGGGEVREVNCNTWYEPYYQIPYDTIACQDDGGVAFKVWWMQNIPGRGNNLTYQGNPLKNWWDFYADFDNAIAINKSLVATGADTVRVSSSVSANGWDKGNLVDGIKTSTSASMGWSSDGNLGTNHTEWAQIDLGSARAVNSVKLYPRTDNPGLFFPIDFQIQTSIDGTIFTTVASLTNYPNPGATPQSFYFTATSARYIRVNFTKLMMAEGSSHRVQLAEIEALSTAPSPSVSPSVSPSPSPSPSANVNLIKNSSFEGSTDWTLGTNSSIDSTVARSGTSSLRVAGDAVSYTRQAPILKPNTLYSYSYWIRTANVTGQGGYFRYTQDTLHNIVLAEGEYDKGTQDWKRVSGSFETTLSYQTGYYYLGYKLNAGDVAWFDDAFLCEGDVNCLSRIPYLPPAPSPQPSPSARKPGDIDGNNRVDIFDYNQLLTDFGKTGADLISDIEKSGTSLNRVDIFDYNLLLSNFGK